jgi:pyruvate formate lyase activating enzyme
MSDVPTTPSATLVLARNIALKAGLQYVYTGNVHHTEGDTTYCASCQAPLIRRDWYQIDSYRLTADGCCPDCGTALAGRFAAKAGHFGRQRIPIAMGR